MRKNRGINSTTAITKKRKHLHQYFDINPSHHPPPNPRSIPKHKPQPRHNKSNKKQNITTKRLSQGKMQRPKPKENNSPHYKSKFASTKNQRFEHSINREYDSPSKDNEEIDFIFKGTQKKVKGNSAVELIVEKINELLKQNKLTDAINVLRNALQTENNNPDLQYFLGVCHIFNGSYDEALCIFEEMLRGKFKKTIYLLLSICYKKTNRLEECEQILNKCIKEYPKYYEAYIYRGKLFLKLKKNEVALSNFDKAISLDGSKEIGYIGKGDCLRLLERYDEAKHFYSNVINNKRGGGSLLLRRAICNMELRKYELALEDINKLLEGDGEDSEALYFKGLIFNKLKQHNEAIICYEQAIKHNSNKRAVTRSIYEITKIKIQNRDYYEALYTLQRAQYLDIDERVVKKFKIFTNGVTAMMKKNYQDGIKILTELLEDHDRPLSNFLKPLFYSTRAYGYMALEHFQNAKEDLQLMESEFALDLPNLYNKFICEGILACNNQKYQLALTLFSKAAKALPYRIQPAFYKAVTLICFSTKLIPKELASKKRQYIESAMKTISKVESIQNNASLYMIRGLILYALGDPDSAYNDLDKCYTESTKPHPLAFYLTGLILAEKGKNDLAISEFKRTIQSKDTHLIPEAYLNRAKCLLLQEQINQAFVDLQSYMAHRQTSSEIHVWAGHLLFHIKAYADANKAYSNINNVNKNFEVLHYKAKIYLITKDVLNALGHLKMMLDIKRDPKVQFDYELIDCLRECSEENFTQFKKLIKRMKEAKMKNNNQFGNIVKEHEYQFYKGVLYFYSKDYEHAISNFNKAKKCIDHIKEEKLNTDDPQFFNQYYSLNFENQAFSQAELEYNIALCHFMHLNIQKGGDTLYDAYKLCPESKSKLEIEKFLQYLGTQNKILPNKGTQMEFIPFPDSDRLCSIFPKVTLPIAPGIQSRLSFCLPRVVKPDITPRFQQKVLEQIGMSSIEIKPQAPWIRRSDHGVIFTDQVVRYDIEISQSSQSEQEEEEKSEYSQEQEEEEESRDPRKKVYYEQGEGERDFEEEPQRMTGNQLREFFKLDKKIEEKLAKNVNKQ